MKQKEASAQWGEAMVPGKHEVDLSVYAKVAAHEALQQRGVVRMSSGVTDKLGMGRTPGVAVHLDDGKLKIDLTVIVAYGADLRRLGPAVQEAVLNAIRQMSDQPVGAINVYVADIEFGERDAKPFEERNVP